MSTADSPIVVVIGGGFGGIAAVQALAKAAVNVVLIDKQNHHLFQPLLYQVATSVLPSSNIAFPIRRIFRDQENAYVFNDEVIGIDLAAQRLVFANNRRAPYDYLIVAAGAGTSYFGHDEWAQFAPGMKSLEDATVIRNRILRAFEDAEAETDPVALRAHLTFVVVGGGATGVELSGAIKELGVDSICKDYRRFDAKSARVILAEAGDRLLSNMSHNSSDAALKALEKIGVEVRLKQSVTNVWADSVEINGERVYGNTIVWTAGVEANSLGASLGAQLDRNGRVKVEPDCSVKGAPNVFVIGDMATMNCAKTGKPVPGVASAAAQMGKFVARIIAREVAATNKQAKLERAKHVGAATNVTTSAATGTQQLNALPQRGAFVYLDKGSMATIGRAKAVAEVAGLKFHGLIAWLAWLFIHLILLVGFHNRILVFLSWGFSYLTFSKGSRIISGNPKSHVVAPVGAETGNSPLDRREAVDQLLQRMQ
ncbi:MAG: NAD(P)/FAD-dependent oxidoreductase [Phycisphaerales bacterium]|nr:NAD(P)/FAD-dependent oxidoreductase [Phycisphaerales bacterium]